MNSAPEQTPSRQFPVNTGRHLWTLRPAPNTKLMNWLTLVALSAAGASGAVDGGDAGAGSPPAIVSEAETELDGVVVPRADGGFLQVKMEGVNLVLRTYDAQKKPVAVDVDRATVRLQFASRSPEQYTLAPSDDKMALTVGRPIRHPHVFRAYISFFRGESETAVETFQLAYP